MPMIKLYSIPPSLYSAKVRLVLRAKGLEFEDVPPPGGYGSDAYKALVPSGTLPAIDHDGFLLTDSEAINEYLNELVPEPRMWPTGLRERAEARALSRFHDTRLEPSLRALFGHVDPSKRNGAFVDAQIALLTERIGQLARICKPSPLMTGAGLSLCDCGFAITFELLSQLNAAMELAILLPEPIAGYIAALRDDPVVAAELITYRPAVAAWVAAETGD
jgi:glutathione S-transferase/maleylpyruvate isomerase